MPYDPPRDVCASAPTGSGKTLAYVVPIVEVCFRAYELALLRILNINPDPFNSDSDAFARARRTPYARSRYAGAGDVRGRQQGSGIEGEA